MPDPHPELPGTHIDIKLKCPVCGWNFSKGLRSFPGLSEEHGDGDHTAITCCGKCLTTLRFNLDDGSDVQVVTPEMEASFPENVRKSIEMGRLLSQLAKGML